MREAKKEENKSFYLTYCNFNIGGLFTSGSARLGKLWGGRRGGGGAGGGGGDRATKARETSRRVRACPPENV